MAEDTLVGIISAIVIAVGGFIWNKIDHSKLSNTFNYIRGGVDQAVPLMNQIVTKNNIDTATNVVGKIDPQIAELINKNRPVIEALPQFATLIQQLINDVNMLKQNQKVVTNGNEGKPSDQTTAAK